MIRASKFSLVAVLASGCLTASSQDSKPAKKSEVKKAALKAATRLLYTVGSDPEERTTKIYSYDLAKKTSSLLPALELAYWLEDLSPNQKTMVLHQISETADNIVFADVKTGQLHKTQPLKGLSKAVFKSNTQIYALQRVKNDANGIQTRIVEMDFDGKNRKLIFESKDGYWDNIPLKLSPNGKYLTYFYLGQIRGQGNIALVNVKTGKRTPLKNQTTLLFWTPDSKRLSTFGMTGTSTSASGKTTASAFIYSLNEKDGSIIEEKKLGQGVAVAGWINNKAYVAIHFGPDGNSSKIHGLSKDPLVLASSCPSDSINLRYFDYDPVSHSIVYTANNKDGNRLMHAVLKDGKVTAKETIGRGKGTFEFIGFPYFVRD